ncbi:MAG: hypothetical protein AB1898_33200 [Acidobacteriota bacterium]
MRRLLLFLVIACGVVIGKDKTPTPFVLDESKPYAYIVFDHAGKRQPI